MAQLYRNAKDRPVQIHSYSGGDDWRFCPRKYKLGRVDGWRERQERASKHFGVCIEMAIQDRILRGKDAVKSFDAMWQRFDPAIENLCDHPGERKPCPACAEQADFNRALTYSDKERDWVRMGEVGTALMRLFEVCLPSLPLERPRFSIELKKEVFPGTRLGGIYFKAVLDILSSPDPNHLALAPGFTESGKHRPLLIDVKTTARAFPDSPAIVALDPQLASYSWVTDVPDVAFLTLVKAAPELERGSKVTALINGKEVQAGAEMVCIEPLEDKTAWALLPNNPEVLAALDGYAGALKGNARITKRLEFAANAGTALRAADLTTQRIQFLPAQISIEARAEIGQVIGQQIAEIVAASERNFFPKVGGIRWPNDKCLNCVMRGICSGDAKLRDELVFKPDEEWLEEEEAA